MAFDLHQTNLMKEKLQFGFLVVAPHGDMEFLIKKLFHIMLVKDSSIKFKTLVRQDTSLVNH